MINMDDLKANNKDESASSKFQMKNPINMPKIDLPKFNVPIPEAVSKTLGLSELCCST